MRIAKKVAKSPSKQGKNKSHEIILLKTAQNYQKGLAKIN